MKKIILIAFLLLSKYYINAQQANQFNSWWYYSGKYQLDNKFNIQTLYSWSRHDFVKDWQQSKLRIATGYDYSNNLSFSLGYEWVILFPYGQFPVPEKRIEHRIYEQIIIKNKIDNVSINYGIQLEQRFLNELTRHRLRLIFAAKYPIIKSDKGKEKLTFSFFDQIILNIDNEANGKNFSQNRVYAGFEVPINKTITLGLGYMNQYIVIKENKYENDHTLMVSLNHKLDFRSKKKL
ncbi:DUF2490 domain-containing protein [Flavobacterium sp. J27]|uniref:DUF2490 domain-containing protein n=1 Tax=Flavobacterium sp. J27 TaxID=2060419 RepID=UPI0010301F6C|nr:DUF2490 domain-containing protein [Flavobacterium sp. J27]